MLGRGRVLGRVLPVSDKIAAEHRFRSALTDPARRGRRPVRCSGALRPEAAGVAPVHATARWGHQSMPGLMLVFQLASTRPPSATRACPVM